MGVQCEGVQRATAKPSGRLRRGEISLQQKRPAPRNDFSRCWSVAPIWRDNVQVADKAAWGRSCGSAKLLAGTLRCLHLCWRLPWDWSEEEQLGRCPKPHKGRCPLTLQGALPLDPFFASRLERASQRNRYRGDNRTQCLCEQNRHPYRSRHIPQSKPSHQHRRNLQNLPKR